MAAVNDPDEIARALTNAKTIAVVGCSPEESRPSNAIARYLLRAGYDVARRLTAAGIPVAMDRCIFRDHSAL